MILDGPGPRSDPAFERSASLAPDVSVIIVTYNCRAFIGDCLASLPGGAGTLRLECIVVDNASPDGTASLVGAGFPDVCVLRNPENRGFAAACNQGMRAAAGRYLLLLNPDTIVGPGAIESTAGTMDNHRQWAAASAKVVRPDGSLDPSCKRVFPSPWDAFARMTGLSRLFPRSRVFARYDTFYLDENTTQEVPLIDACYMMIRREALRDIGALDERFFMYAEEMDWCLRAGKKGWAIGYAPSGTVVHLKGEVTRHSTFRMLYHFHRSMALYYLKYNRWWSPAGVPVLGGIAVRLVGLSVWNLLRSHRRVSG
ncbi:MAG: glycosyltransferase family 2 protein [Candidatus Eisenbacteria bacterium]